MKSILGRHRKELAQASQHPVPASPWVLDDEEIDFSSTSTPRRRHPAPRTRSYSHITPEVKKIIAKAVRAGSTVRQVAKSAGVSVGTVSRIVHLAPEDLEVPTRSGGHRDCLQKVDCSVSRALAELVSTHPDLPSRLYVGCCATCPSPASVFAVSHAPATLSVKSGARPSTYSASRARGLCLLTNLGSMSTWRGEEDMPE